MPPLAVRADPLRFRQILDNLLSNAIKFTPENGRIAVTAVPDGGEVAITVEDTGVGIAETDHDQGLRGVPPGRRRRPSARRAPASAWR